MKAASLIHTGVLLLFLGAVTPIYAQEQQDQNAKPEKQDQDKPATKDATKPAKNDKTDKQATDAKAPKDAKAQNQAPDAKTPKDAKDEKQAPDAKPGKPVDTAKQPKPDKEARQEAQARSSEADTTRESSQQASPNQGNGQPGQGDKWARNGQKDSAGHEYSESRFGRDHHVRFEENGGRMYGGHREYSFGGYWFYADSYPPWFYQQEVYFIMGADGLWYAVAYDNPSLTFQVYIQ